MCHWTWKRLFSQHLVSINLSSIQECRTHFLGPLKYTALTRGCSWNPNMGIQSPATSHGLLWREWEFGGQGLLNKAPFSIWESLKLGHPLLLCHLQLGRTCGARTDLSRDPVSMSWGGDSCQAFWKPLQRLSLTWSRPAYLCILLLGLQTTFLCKQPVVAVTVPVLERAERSLVHLNVWNHSSCFYSIYSVKQCLYLQYLAFI